MTVSKTRSGSVCCRSSSLRSCVAATVHPLALGQPYLNLPGGVTVAFSNHIAGNKNAYHYTSKNAEAVITYSPNTGGMHGHASLSSGASFVLENCGKDGHVWAEIDIESFGANEGVDFVAPEENLVYDTEKTKRLREQASNDSTTVVTYSIKFYYTPEFAASTPDIPGFIDQVLSETNQGYANSGVPLVATVHCIEAATINDNDDSSAMLSEFKNMKPTTRELRGGADATAILVDDFRSCGIAYLYTISSGNTVSATMKRCAVGYYSFGHELGHNIGLTHDPDTSTNSRYAYGHGHLITQGTATTGYRTILAYSATGHSTRVNYYSNPDVNYPPTGTPTGVAGTANNARLLIENRMALAAVDDESTSCGDGTSTTAPVASTAAPTSCPTYAKRIPVLKVIKTVNRVSKISKCKALCRAEPGCEHFAWLNAGSIKKKKCRLFANDAGFKKINGNWISGSINC